MSEQENEQEMTRDGGDNPIQQLEQLFEEGTENVPELQTGSGMQGGPENVDCKSAGQAESAEKEPASADDLPFSFEEEKAATEQGYRPVYRQPSGNRRKANRFWGWLIGIALLFLSAACIVLICGMGLRAGRRATGGGLMQSVTPKTQQTVPEANAPEDAPEIKMYDIPREEEGYTTQYIVEQVRESVVGVMVYDGTGVEAVGGGSGIVLSEDGYIVTNAHVVDGAVGVAVVLADETHHTAKIVGSDEKTDLAVLKISAENLKPAVFGDSTQVQTGEKAIVIGNPGGLTGSVSQGIISATEREFTRVLSDGSYVTVTVMQTDAAINPGNSGGPLLNSWGQVIGINSSKVVSDGYEGIGFAIPISVAQPIIGNLITYGYVRDRAILGVQLDALDASNGPANGLPSQGLYIASIQPGSDMLNQGIQPGDVILKAAGLDMVACEDLTNLLKDMRPGDYITMEILRTYDNTTVTVDVLLKDSVQMSQSASAEK